MSSAGPVRRRTQADQEALFAIFLADLVIGSHAESDGEGATFRAEINAGLTKILRGSLGLRA
jgi:hypothetical protein